MTDVNRYQSLRIVLASNNPKKVAEMRTLLPESYAVLSAKDAGVELPEETGTTFEANALLKARAAARQSGLIAVADDSGLVVDALDGAPGVRSARFAADHGRQLSEKENNRLLLELLEAVPAHQRGARFESAVAIVTPEGSESVCYGEVRGQIGFEPRGAGGFGYDPLFTPCGKRSTMAELKPDEKNAVSHRGQAFRKAVVEIEKIISETASA